MFSEDEIREIINHKIESDELTGYQGGGSSHLAYKTCRMNSFEASRISLREIEIIYQYTVYVETEFTYFPDNPPAEYQHKKIIIVNSKGEVIREKDLDA